MAETARLKSGLWVRATLRTCQAHGVNCVVARRGDEDGGSILIKQNWLGRGFCVLTRLRMDNDEMAWMRGTGPDLVEETVADAYIDRQVGRDSDLWVLEIEDRGGRLPFPHRLV